MQIFGFDFLAYPQQLDHLKQDGELPYPLAKEHFKPELAVSNYEEHLEAWCLMDELGFDGVGFNEHHTSPYGLMTSPNVMAAAASQRLKRMKMLIYGNLLPIHEPLRLAEELSMLDCLSNGRLISGFARGIPREYLAYNVSMAESRGRFEEAYKIIKKAWTEEVFSYEGEYWSYSDVAIWPRPLQQPHPPVWIPVSASQETLDWAGRENVPISPGALGTLAGRQDMVRYYGRQLAENGYTLTPEHIIGTANAYVADSREQALAEAGPYMVYFYRTLFGHGNTANVERQRATGYRSERNMEWLSPENREDFLNSIQTFREATMESIEHQDRLCFGTPDEVRDSIIDLAESLGSNVLMLHFNRGSMPHSMFMNQIQRFGEEVLPALHEHQVTTALSS